MDFLVKTSALTGVAAADQIIAKAKALLPGSTAIKTVDAIGALMDKMEAFKVSETQIEAIAKAKAALILAGIEAQIKAGGANAPTSVDIAAAAEVLNWASRRTAQRRSPRS